MSANIYDVDERLWDEYLMECRAAKEGGIDITPSLKDFSIWLQENDYDQEEV
jgi:hypothetical protein